MNGTNDFLRDKMRSFGAAIYQKFLCQELIHDWDKIVDESIAKKIRPVTIERGVLFVDVQGSAWKDQLKFFAEEIIDAVNKNFPPDAPPLKALRVAPPFMIKPADAVKISAPVLPDVLPVTPEQIALTDEEVALCKARAAKISDENLRQSVFETMLTQVQAQKFRTANDWHKCTTCDTLCPPDEIFCEPCKIREREAMVAELFKIFYDEPHLSTSAAQEILLERMPHMRRECSPEAVESARTSLIQKVAGRVRFGDEKSPDVLKLVMLEKRLPSDKITPTIIRRTLLDLQFNLSDQARLRRYALRSARK